VSGRLDVQKETGDSLSVPLEADPRCRGWDRAAVGELHLGEHDRPQLGDVLDVERVRHGRREPDVELIKKCGATLTLKASARWAVFSQGVIPPILATSALEDPGGAGGQVLAEVARRVDALADRDGDARGGREQAVAAQVLGRQRLLDQ
jgi:hypothetical protein